jgi:transcriptional regulator with XRE-family HTH domain
MRETKVDAGRGARLQQAMKAGGHRKMMALAVELDVSPAAFSKWTQGYAMSIEHACRLADLLDVSLDWLLMDRNGPDWLQPNQLSELELDLVGKLRERPARIVKLLIRLTAEISKIPPSD